MKRGRGETNDRDGTEVQQRRVGPRHQRNTSLRLPSLQRSDGNARA